MQHVRDRLVRSDPGLARLRMAVAGASAMASALAVEAAFAGLIGAGRQGTLIAMLLGAVVSMMGSMALTGTRVWGKVRTAAFFPVAVGVGLVAGVSVSGHTRTMLVMFVALMFVAVFVRRFGIDFFFYGFMMWIGFFFTSLLRATAEQLPLLLGATVVASVWVLVLSATVLRTHPGRTLARVRRAFGARARALADACAELLETDAAAARELERRRRRLHGAHARLAETALMIEAWSAEEGALPPGSSAAALRRRILDLQLALDRVAVAAERLAGSDSALRPGAERVCRLMSRRRYAGVRKAARNLHLATEQDEGTGAEERRAARHLAAAADDFVTSVPPTDSSPVPDEDPFEPAVTLALGNLPGSPAVAQDVAPRGWRWNPVRRMDFTTRQAVQVTLAGVIAVVLGRELDSTRYYWAVITAFIAFTGTGTRSEAFLKAFNRVLGTLLGLGAGIWLAQLTAGHTAWMLAVIIASVFFGFYLQRVSYAYMIFFITIMIAQLYGILHQFSDGLLMLRLEETVIGAVAGIAVALLFTPLSTRDTISATQSRLLTDLADLLETAAGTAAGGLDAAMRGVDNRLRQLLQAVAPLSHPLVWDASPGATRHRLTLYGSCVRTTRSLAATLRHDPARQDPALEACRPLASAARRIAVHPGPPGARPYEPGQPLLDDLARADEILFADAEPPASPESPRRALVRLHELLEELAVGERPAAGGQSYAELSR